MNRILPPNDAFPYKAPIHVRVGSEREQWEHKARAHLQRLGVTGIVRYEFAPIEEPNRPRARVARTRILLFDIHRPRKDGSSSKSPHSKATRTGRATTHSSSTRRRKYGKCKVEQLPNGALTCSHPGWHHGVNCWHIREARAQWGISDGDPYSLARRRPPTRWFFPEPPGEEARRNNARIDAVTRVPEMLSDLCIQHIPLPKRSGRIGLTRRATVYSLGMKVFWKCSYAALGPILARDPNFVILAPNWLERMPTLQTFCTRFGDELLGGYIEVMSAASARPASRIDRTVIVDSDNIPTVPSANSRNEKFGGPPPAWRAVATMVKRHFAVGDVTGLVGAVDITLDEGLGSGDGPHLGSILTKARAIFENAVNVVADKAYSIRRSFIVAERLKFDLYVPERGNEKRLTSRKRWPMSARRIALLQRDNPPRFRQVYRMRSKGEFVPSSTKRRYPCVRLRPRKRDRVPQYPEGLSFAKRENDIDLAISKLDEVSIAAIMAGAQTAVGYARLNETLMTILLENLYRLVTLEHFFNKRVDFSNRDFAFEGVTLVSEIDVDRPAI